MRERAVRMVLDHGHEYGSQWEAICSVAEKLGSKAETVRLGVRQVERDSGPRPGATTAELGEVKRLKRENADVDDELEPLDTWPADASNPAEAPHD